MRLSLTLPLAFLLLLALHLTVASGQLVKVEGHALDFVGPAIVGAKIRVLEQPGLVVESDHTGYFQFQSSVGSEITLVLNHPLYRETQGPTVTVPASGLVGVEHEMVLQVPNSPTYQFLKAILPAQVDDEHLCQLVVTVTAPGKTIYDDPQGEANSTCTLSPSRSSPSHPYYFGMFKNGATNPFTRGLNSTSQDGGVVFFNVPVGNYTITAQKEGVVWQHDSSYLRCIEGSPRLVNAAPTWGPRALSD
mmetsp:Transcript_32910/g.82673  ORF Transcript_32910/g.82673 Transcript_32910/m.82673 type:complete len:248 (+) Transcript_32910:59-802(+)